ncbi:methylmalonyl-CoA mutase small subunit [Antrihabitans cavernicola]|uniref:Methylmalonyl-CoA mutase small subunit n=1 Tax=Antrihabitans cavernicola TaxID=2495913 RepID=A0A5A7SE03_9NOCA|nr:methylmalonyl-CoA mutase small subunit [Spelaeibacter cavernicola]KAA0023599.1 methylmalonyl-CoA mutase small subunit [Spelaeibacter cavernicola]
MPNGYADWQRSVAGVLAKARKVDVSELPADPEKLLAVRTYDGATVSPLYTAGNELPEPGLPGTFPYVRGRDAHRDVNSGWSVGGRFTDPDPATTNRAILDGLVNGVSAIWLGVGTNGVPVGAIGAALAEVLLDLAPLTLDAGSDAIDAAHAVFALLDERAQAGDGVTDRAKITVSLGAAPLTSAFSNAPDITLPDAVALAIDAAGRTETVRAITVDGTAFHNAGASDAQEVGAAVAAGLEYVRTLTESGSTASTAFRQLEFRYAATDDQFQSIAKFRAARRVWARIAQVCGASNVGGAPQHAVTSAAMMTQRDPWVNMLRTTLAAFGAGVGGADAVTVLPFDAAVPLGGLDISKTFAARVARNTQLLLLEESHLGRVLDPGAGSWYVESLTDDIAGKAWEFFQEIESAGGYTSAVESGVVGDRIATTRAARESDIAHRKTSVTGINEFPNLAENPLPSDAPERLAGVARYSAAFEALRDRSDKFLADNGSRPTVLLAALGPVAEHNGRTTFAANLLASGGVEAINPGTVDAETIAKAVSDSGTAIAVLCGTDKRYGTDGPQAVRALRAAGVTTVLLAGPEKAFADAVNSEDRPDDYLTARIDAVSAMSDLLDSLGAK